MTMMTKEMGTALTGEAGRDPWKGEAVTHGVLQAHMAEAGRGTVLIMGVVRVHITNPSKGVVLITEEMEVQGMRGTPGLYHSEIAIMYCLDPHLLCCAN